MLSKLSYSLFFIALVFALIFSVGFSGIPSAHADSPQKLEDHITDPQNTLSDQRSVILDKIKDVKQKTDLDVWIVFMSTFDGVTEDLNADGKIDASDWAEETANMSGFGPNDVVFAVATTTHEIVIYVPKDAKTLKQHNVEIISNTVLIPLRAGNWANASLRFCDTVITQSQSEGVLLPYIIFGGIFVALTVYLLISMHRKQFGGNIPGFFKAQYWENRSKRRDQAVLTQSVDANTSDIVLPKPLAEDVLKHAETSSIAAQTDSVQSTHEISDAPKQPADSLDTLYSSYSIPEQVHEQTQILEIQPEPSQSEPEPPKSEQLANHANQEPTTLSRFPSKKPARVPYSEYVKQQNQTQTQMNAQGQAQTQAQTQPQIYPSSSTQPSSENQQTLTTEQIYSDYYVRSASKETYGSYYSDNSAAQHDASVNQTFKNTVTAQNSYVSEIPASNISTSDPNSTTEELFEKYYKEDMSILDKLINKATGDKKEK